MMRGSLPVLRCAAAEMYEATLNVFLALGEVSGEKRAEQLSRRVG